MTTGVIVANVQPAPTVVGTFGAASHVIDGSQTMVVVATAVTGPGGGGGSGLPSGGTVGQVVTNTGSGTGDWDNAIAAAFPYTPTDITIPFDLIPISYKWMAFAQDEPAISWGKAGDAYPRVCILVDPTDGWYFSDGTFDAYNDGGPQWAILADEFARGFFFNSGHNANVPTVSQIRLEAGAAGVAGKTTIQGSLQVLKGDGPTGVHLIRGSTTFDVSEDPTTKNTVTIAAAFEQATPLLDFQDENGNEIGRVTPNGTPIFNAHAAPADAALNNSDFAFWLDDTPGSTALRVKAKDSAGTVRTATIPLS